MLLSCYHYYDIPLDTGWAIVYVHISFQYACCVYSMLCASSCQPLPNLSLHSYHQYPILVITALRFKHSLLQVHTPQAYVVITCLLIPVV